MTIARSSKRHGLRSEASHRFERGVDPELGLRAAARFVAILRESVPELEWLADPLDVRGDVAPPPTLTLSDDDLRALLGITIERDELAAILTGMDFTSPDRRAVGGDGPHQAPRHSLWRARARGRDRRSRARLQLSAYPTPLSRVARGRRTQRASEVAPTAS